MQDDGINVAMEDVAKELGHFADKMRMAQDAREYVNVLIAAAVQYNEYTDMVGQFQHIMSGKSLPTGIVALAVALADALLSQKACVTKEDIEAATDIIEGKPASEEMAAMMFAALGQRAVASISEHHAAKEEADNADQIA